MLFLDEIGELGLDEQAMLLRAIEEKRFLPVGSDSEATSDFQLIAGTNRDLIDRVSDGRFREDLLARINLWTFCLPALRSGEKTSSRTSTTSWPVRPPRRAHGDASAPRPAMRICASPPARPPSGRATSATSRRRSRAWPRSRRAGASPRKLSRPN